MKNLTEAAYKAYIGQDNPEHVSEIRNPMAEKYLKVRDESIVKGLKKYPSDFYIQMMFFKDKTNPYQNAMKILGRAARGVASPTFQNDMWKYHRSSDTLELLWALPSLDVCMDMLTHKEFIEPQDYPLLEHVIGLFDGSLDRICDAENEKAVQLLDK
jgi:hypothetical protein